MIHLKYLKPVLTIVLFLILLFSTNSSVFAIPITSAGLADAWESGGDSGAWSYVDGSVSIGAMLDSLGEIIGVSLSSSGVFVDSKGDLEGSSYGVDADKVENGVTIGSLFASIYYQPSPSASVPEPSTLLLLGFGMAGLIGFGRKRLVKKA